MTGVVIHAGDSNLGRGMTQAGSLHGGRGGGALLNGPRPQPREGTPAQRSPPFWAGPPPPGAPQLLPAKPGPSSS